MHRPPVRPEYIARRSGPRQQYDPVLVGVQDVAGAEGDPAERHGYVDRARAPPSRSCAGWCPAPGRRGRSRPGRRCCGRRRGSPRRPSRSPAPARPSGPRGARCAARPRRRRPRHSPRRGCGAARAAGRCPRFTDVDRLDVRAGPVLGCKVYSKRFLAWPGSAWPPHTHTLSSLTGCAKSRRGAPGGKGASRAAPRTPEPVTATTTAAGPVPAMDSQVVPAGPGRRRSDPAAPGAASRNRPRRAP